MMSTDEEIARRAIAIQQHAKDIPMMKLPGYKDWSKKKLKEGESEALIAHLDSMSIWLLPEDVEGITEKDFDEMLQDLKEEIGDG